LLRKAAANGSNSALTSRSSSAARACLTRLNR
jgi:hypothetical protein